LHTQCKYAQLQLSDLLSITKTATWIILKKARYLDGPFKCLFDGIANNILYQRVVSELANHETEFNFYKGEKTYPKKRNNPSIKLYKKISDIKKSLRSITIPTNRCHQK